LVEGIWLFGKRQPTVRSLASSYGASSSCESGRIVTHLDVHALVSLVAVKVSAIETPLDDPQYVAYIDVEVSPLESEKTLTGGLD